MEHRVIVGLGNPGKKYEMTRHNIGYLVLHALAKGWNLTFKEEKRFQAYVIKGQVDDFTVHLLLPTTYMNDSGQAIRSYLDYFKLDVSSLIVVTDDIALDFGQLRVRISGSSGGHNGLKSVEAHVGTNKYCRLRMGVGDRQKGDLVDHVLSPFSPEEFKTLPDFIVEGAKVVIRLLHEDVENVMNAVNKRKNNTQKKIPQNGVGEKT